ncbi:uncharacterized protein LOC131166827 isoform X2 [Malania oleifera]|uniref:uncharacterized protein LOC131166827 isoform X2 n=1 Tax=Malania oleifera TaxID=397392 RepID=UPI0025ADCE11|nr:uncharacterized protein LOC131166827 isoform X2 [Malania oleifera]
MATQLEPKLERFLQWLQSNGVELRGCKIKYCDSTKRFGLFSSNEVSDDDELLELKGTTLYRATELQKKKLQSLYDDRVKILVKKVLALTGDPEREVCFEDFLWANSVFWTRALNIPFPHSYVFPQFHEEQDSRTSLSKASGACSNLISSGQSIHEKDAKALAGQRVEKGVTGMASTPIQGQAVWVEGLVPGIDFCNHDLKPAATWEVDGTGQTTAVPFSMYLISGHSTFQIEKEISISYGNKGNEELLYLYGFVIENNPDDYLMVHYPVEALQSGPFADSKAQLLEAQKAEMRCLLPRSLLDHGFCSAGTPKGNSVQCKVDRVCSYSWSGQRRMPTYSNKLVFSEDFLTALRTIAMQENELFQVSSMLEELVGSEDEREPSDTEVRAAVWEACGDSGALQLLVDILNMKMMDLEEGSGKEERDAELLEKALITEISEEYTCQETNGSIEDKLMSRNRWSSIVYRQGQKQLTAHFLKEAEHALQLCLSEEN